MEQDGTHISHYLILQNAFLIVCVDGWKLLTCAVAFIKTFNPSFLYICMVYVKFFGVQSAVATSGSTITNTVQLINDSSCSKHKALFLDPEIIRRLTLPLFLPFLIVPLLFNFHFMFFSPGILCYNSFETHKVAHTKGNLTEMMF